MPILRRVILISGMDLYSALDLPTDLFLMLYKTSVMEDLRATEAGREYLEKCRRMTVTEPDYDALRKRGEYIGDG